MVFEVGKFYKHSTGICLSIIGKADTTMYGKTLIAEEAGGANPHFIAVGEDEASTANWHEIEESEWMENFA